MVAIVLCLARAAGIFLLWVLGPDVGGREHTALSSFLERMKSVKNTMQLCLRKAESSGVLLVLAVGLIMTNSIVVSAQSADAGFGPTNPFYAASALPFQVPPFDKIVPTTENVAAEIWRRLEPHLRGAERRLHSIRLYETPDLFVDYFGDERRSSEAPCSA